MLPTIERNVLKAIYWIKQVWNDVKCNNITKCFKKCGFVDNTAKNLAELFCTTADELCEIDANNEESDDDNDDEIDFNLNAKKVLITQSMS